MDAIARTQFANRADELAARGRSAAPRTGQARRTLLQHLLPAMLPAIAAAWVFKAVLVLHLGASGVDTLRAELSVGGPAERAVAAMLAPDMLSDAAVGFAYDLRDGARRTSARLGL